MESKERNKIFVSTYLPFLFVLILFALKIAEHRFGWDAVKWGIYPKELHGLKGILTSPFIHGDFRHLFNNAVPLIILGTAIMYFYQQIAGKVVVMIVLFEGLLTWIFGRPSYHIGASGLLYGLFAFLLISGFVRNNNNLKAISFLVAFIYGSLVWGILPIDPKISWESHLFGLIVGIVLAIAYRKQGPPVKAYFEDEEDDEEDEDDYWNTGNADEIVQYHIRQNSRSSD